MTSPKLQRLRQFSCLRLFSWPVHYGKLGHNILVGITLHSTLSVMYSHIYSQLSNLIWEWALEVSYYMHSQIKFHWLREKLHVVNAFFSSGVQAIDKAILRKRCPPCTDMETYIDVKFLWPHCVLLHLVFRVQDNNINKEHTPLQVKLLSYWRV